MADARAADEDTLRVLAEGTGGFAVINRNDIRPSLQRIDAATSDYHVIGYYSNNADVRKRTRPIDVRVSRPGMQVMHRTSYSIAQPSPGR